MGLVVSRSSRTTVVSRSSAVLAIAAAASAPALGEQRRVATSDRNFPLCRARLLVGFSRRLRRSRFGRSAGLCRPRRLCAVCPERRGGDGAALYVAADRRRSSARLRAHRALAVSPARRLFRDHLLGRGGGVPLEHRAQRGARRRLGHEPAGRGGQDARAHPARPFRRRLCDVLVLLALVLATIFLTLRSRLGLGAHRHPGQRTRRALERRQRRPRRSSPSMSPPPRGWR